jgi:predicted DCC family thiol-disulfide oxidoreductase YuxK
VNTAATWNPLRCDGTAVPANLLLLAKIVAVAYLLSDIRMLPAPFLSFIPPLDYFAGPEPYAWTLRAVFFASGIALLCNRAPRLSAFVMGLAVMTAVVGSKAYYGNNKLFSASMLLLTGLWHPRLGPWLLRAQIVIVYFGAGLNKLLDPDWHSGQFFHHWAGARLEQPLYLWANQWFPPLLLGKLVCWGTILVELGLAVAFLIPRTWPTAIWVSLLFHAGLLEFTGTTFNMFFYAMEAAMLSFVAWPREKLVIYDGDCGICNKIRRWLQRVDFEQPPAFAWRTLQSGAGKPFGITRQALEQRLHAVFDGRVYAGFRACKMILLYNPVLYLALAVLLAAPPGNWIWYRRILVAALLAFFFPPFNFIGERVYNWVAANRHRFSSDGACAVEPGQTPANSASDSRFPV